jgi:ABC-type methionine transport system permease subunit
MLMKIDKIDETIIEKESFQIIIDFKWDSYARKFFSVQLGLFICFMIAFIFDVVAVSKNSHIFSSDDFNQLIPRIISIVIMIPFAIYEFANIEVTRTTYFKIFWNYNDLLLIALYFAYFTTTFARPDLKDLLKSL